MTEFRVTGRGDSLLRAFGKNVLDYRDAFARLRSQADGLIELAKTLAPMVAESLNDAPTEQVRREADRLTNLTNAIGVNALDIIERILKVPGGDARFRLLSEALKK